MAVNKSLAASPAGTAEFGHSLWQGMPVAASAEQTCAWRASISCLQRQKGQLPFNTEG